MRHFFSLIKACERHFRCRQESSSSFDQGAEFGTFIRDFWRLKSDNTSRRNCITTNTTSPLVAALSKVRLVLESLVNKVTVSWAALFAVIQSAVLQLNKQLRHCVLHYKINEWY